MSLTADECERLRVWSAGVMGWHSIPYPDHPEESQGWFDDKEVVVMHYRLWNPLVSLDQAVMVADKVGELRGVVWMVRRTKFAKDKYLGSTTANGEKEYLADKPAEALLVACADAAGEKWP